MNIIFPKSRNKNSPRHRRINYLLVGFLPLVLFMSVTLVSDNGQLFFGQMLALFMDPLCSIDIEVIAKIQYASYLPILNGLL